MDGAEQQQTYEFGGFRLDPGRRRLFSPGGEPIALNSRVFDTLLHLVERRGELLDKAALMRAIWPNTVVEENNLSQAVSALRRALGEKPNKHQFILTEPGRGYRFVAEVRIAGTLTPAANAGLQSVAVLAFADLSPERDQEYFADGIAEELLNRLTRLRGLHVTGRTSSFSFKNKDEDLRTIGERLNVAHILEGSVRKAGNRVRITVQLVKAADGFHIWSKSFDRELNDIFAIQEETAKAVAVALSITLGVGDPDLASVGTRNFEAYDALLAARSLLLQQGRENYSRAIDLLEGAVRLDPNYAEAWSVLAMSYTSAARNFLPDRAEELLRKSEQAAWQAATIAPERIWSLLASSVRLRAQGDWLQAERNLMKALALAPTEFAVISSNGFFLLQTGRPGEAIDYFRQAVRIDPLALAPSLQLAHALQLQGDVAAAMAEFERGKSLIGDHVLLNGAILTLALEIGDRVLIEKYLDIIENDAAGPPQGRSFSRYIRSVLDSPGEASAFLQCAYQDPAYRDPVSRAVISLYASYFGGHEFALRILDELAEQRVLSVEAIWRDVYQGVRRLPGFKGLVRKLGLVDYWRETGRWAEICRPLGPDDFECR